MRFPSVKERMKDDSRAAGLEGLEEDAGTDVIFLIRWQFSVCSVSVPMTFHLNGLFLKYVEPLCAR